MKHVAFLLLPLFVIASCGGNNDPGPLFGDVEEIIVSDNGNAGNASDIEVNFTKQVDEAFVLEYRVFLIKSAKSAEITIDEAQVLSADRYASAAPEDVYVVQGISFSSSDLDADGDKVQNNISYRIGVLSLSKDESIFSSTLTIDNKDFELTVNNLLFDYSKEMNAGAGSLTIDSKDILYMANYDILAQLVDESEVKYVVQRIDNNGSVTTFGEVYGMHAGNAMDTDGTLYQSIFFDGNIAVIHSDGSNELIELPSFVPAKADGIYVNSAGDRFVVDPQNRYVLKITKDGTSSIFASNLRPEPRGIVGREDGTLFVSHNNEAGTVTRVAPDGSVSVLANIPTYVDPFYTPEFLMWAGYIAYHDDHVYVVGTSTHTVYKINMEGEVEPFVGSGDRGIPRGDTRTARLNRPIGIAFSTDGKSLFISGSTDTQPQHTQYSVPSRVYEVRLVEEGG